MHLGMTGSFRVGPGSCGLRKHDHVVWQLGDGSWWIYSDPRRFGLVAVAQVAESGGLPAELAQMGPEPLDASFTGPRLYERLRARKPPIKTVLLDQSVVAGLGNIYVSEVLFKVGISPLRPAGRISRSRAGQLATAIKEVLLDAIACGGTTIRDFQSLDGNEGHFSTCLAVYGKAGSACPRCGPEYPILRTVQAGRSTFHCPNCQRIRKGEGRQ